MSYTRADSELQPLPPASGQIIDIVPRREGDAGGLGSGLGAGVGGGDGLLEPGNIDLQNRPRVRMEDGGTATVRSMGVNLDGREVLLPTVSDDGRIMSDDEAIETYRRTGRHLGIFATPEAASAYAERLSADQARLLGQQPTVEVEVVGQRAAVPSMLGMGDGASMPIILPAEVEGRFASRFWGRMGVLPPAPEQPAAELRAQPDPAGFDAIRSPTEPRRGTLRLSPGGTPQLPEGMPLPPRPPEPEALGPQQPAEPVGANLLREDVTNLLLAMRQGVTASALNMAEPVDDFEIRRRLEPGFNDDGPVAERLAAARERAAELGLDVVFRAGRDGRIEAVARTPDMAAPGGAPGRVADALGRLFGLGFVDPVGGAVALGARGAAPAAGVASAGGAGPRAVRFTPAPASTRLAARQNVTDRLLGLDPQYLRVLSGSGQAMPVAGGRTSQYVTNTVNPGNAVTMAGRIQQIAGRHPDPLASESAWLRMMAETYQSSVVPLTPSYLIRMAGDVGAWAQEHGRLTPQQIEGARRGLNETLAYRQVYSDGTATAVDTGLLAMWGMLSRRMSAYPHEAAFLDMADRAVPFVERAAAGRFTSSPEALAVRFDQSTGEVIEGSLVRGRSDLDDWLLTVREAMPGDSPGRSATSNLNDFGRTFLRKMSERQPNGSTGLQAFHDLLADQSLTGPEIRRAFYGLGEGLGFTNKVLSFMLLVTGRRDVMVLDRIQINRIYGDGRAIYDDVAPIFDTGPGIVQYEALERSLLARLPALYDQLGRRQFFNTFGVSGYHWESWVLNSGQVVEHPTIPLIRQGPAVANSGRAGSVTEGRFYARAYGTEYVVLPEGRRIFVQMTSDGEPRAFDNLRELSAFLGETFSRQSGIMPAGFPGVTALKGGDVPWQEWRNAAGEGIDRGRLDELLRRSGRSLTADERSFVRGAGAVPPPGGGGGAADGTRAARGNTAAGEPGGVTPTAPFRQEGAQ